MNLTTNFQFALLAQDTYHMCSWYDKDNDPSNNNFSGQFFDQFGNNYTEEELTLNLNPPVLPASNCQSGYFNLIFEGPFTNGEIETICAAFDYLSTVIIPVSTSTQVNIWITREFMQDPDSKISERILATGQAFFKNECGINRSLAYLAVNSEEQNVQFIHGKIRFNQFITNWHLIENDGQGQEPNISGFDMFSVTIHEALHIFSWHSLSHTPGGTPIADGHYSVMDQFLYHRYNGVKRPFLLADTEPICCSKKILNPLLGTVSSNPPICNKVTFESEFDLVNVAVGSPLTNMTNHLAHFNESCQDPQNAESFVMHPTIGSGQNKRNISNTEKSAMCAKGYSINGKCGENECIVVVNEDGPFIISTLNDPVKIEPNYYMANDVYTYNDNPGAFTISYLDSCGNTIGCNLEHGIEVDFNPTTSEFTITALEPGFYTICYSLNVWCGFRTLCDDGIIYIYVENPDIPECCAEPDSCYKLCAGGFDELENTLELRQIHALGDEDGLNTFTFGATLNSPVLLQSSFDVLNCDNSTLGTVSLSGNAVKLSNSRANGQTRKDGIMIVLCSPLESDKSMEISFDALASQDCFNGSAELVFELSSCSPLSDMDVYTIPGMVAGPEVVSIAAGTSLTAYDFTITNSSSSPARYLFIHHRLNLVDTSLSNFNSFVIIDDIVAFYNQSCFTVRSVGSVPNTPCPQGKVSGIFEVCNTCSTLNNEISVDIQLPEMMELIPTGSVPTTSFTIPAGTIHPKSCILYEVLVDVGNEPEIDSLHKILFEIDDHDLCTPKDTAFTNFIPVDSIPITIEKNLVWQDTFGLSGRMRFEIIICNTSEYFVNQIEIDDRVSDSLKIFDKGDFSLGPDGLYTKIALLPFACDTLYFEAIPNCICMEGIDNCAIARVFQSGCWDIYNCVPTFDDVRSGPVPDPTFWVSDSSCYTRCFRWNMNDCDNCQANTWTFGFGPPSSQYFPCRIFPGPGEYVVTHTTYNRCGDSVFSDTIVIWEYKPDPDFSFAPLSECGEFQFTSVDAEWEHYWNFGNGQTSSDPNPMTYYEYDGIYTVTHCIRHDTLCGWQCTTKQIEVFCGRYCDCPDDPGNHNVGKYGQTTNLSTVSFGSGTSHDNTGKCISIKGKLVINKSLFTIYGGEIRMHPGAEIEVSANNRLELTNIDENGGIHGCDTMWRSITLKPSSELFFKDNLIQDAENAVLIQGHATVEILDNEFKNNYRGVRLSNSPGTQYNSNAVIMDRTVFNGNIFHGPDLLLPHYQSQFFSNKSDCGIYILNSSAIIGSNDGDNADYQNYYTKMSAGMRVFNSFAVIYSQFIEDISHNDNLSDNGIGIFSNKSFIVMERNKIVKTPRFSIRLSAPFYPTARRNNMVESTTGIFVLNQSYGGELLWNKIAKVQNGIVWDSKAGYVSAPCRIERNNIAVDPDQEVLETRGIYMNQFPASSVHHIVNYNSVYLNGNAADPGYNYLYRFLHVGRLRVFNNYAEKNPDYRVVGFEFVNNFNPIVTGNSFHSDSYSSTLARYIGFNFKGNPEAGICCNNTFNATNGFRFELLSTCRWDFNTNDGEQLYGLTLLNEAIIGRQYLHPINFNPQVQSNQWLGNYSSYQNMGAYNYNSSPEFLDQSLIYYNPNYPATATKNNHQDDLNSNDPEGDWFKTELQSIPEDSCNLGSSCQNLFLRVRESDEAAVQNTLIDTLTNNTGLNWEAQRSLWRKARMEPDIKGTSALVDSFFANNAAEIPALIEKLEFTLDSLRGYESTDSTIITSYLNSFLLMDSLVQEIDNQLANATTYEDSLALSQSKSGVMSLLSDDMEDILAMDSLYRDRFISGIQQLQIEMQSWQPSGVVDSNYTQYYRIYLAHLLSPDSTLSGDDLNTLLDIADQCPAVGGHVVWSARELVRQWMELNWEDDEICNPSEMRSTVKQPITSSHEDVRIYPVPSSDIVYVVVNHDRAALRFEIFDLSGRIIHTRHKGLSGPTIRIDTGGMASGTYRARITMTNGTYVVKPLVILR